VTLLSALYIDKTCDSSDGNSSLILISISLFGRIMCMLVGYTVVDATFKFIGKS
jgi:hypothetical protein